jgi:hypothetical protein
MKPNTVVIGYYLLDKASRVQELDKKLPEKVRTQIMRFPDGPDTMADTDYVSILKDINAASKNLLIARKYVCYLNILRS